MHEYHIDLPKDVQLAVEIETTPITLHLTFKDGERYTFIYNGNPSRTASVTKTTGSQVPIPATEPRYPLGSGAALTKRRISGASGATLEFIDPGGSQMP